MFANANPLGFLGASRAQNAIQIIGKAEQLVEDLGLTLADIEPAEDALSAAKALYAAREYAKAATQAERAGALAASLNDRFNAYMDAWSALQTCMEELRRLGLPTDDLEAVLSAADKEVAHGVEEGGAVVPNYLGAKAMLERAMETVRAFVTRARRTSKEISLASLAVEALSMPQTTRASSWLAVRLEQVLEKATREFALGNLRVAHKLASEVKARAEAARAGAVRARQLLGEAEIVAEYLRAEGLVTDALEESVGSVREALAKGSLDPTTAMAAVRRLSNEAVSFADNYSRALRVLDHAERVYARLQQEGFRSNGVDTVLLEARRALGAGDWARVRENVRCASETFVRRRNERKVLAKAIADTHERVTLLKDLRLRYLPDVQKILGRASEEFQSGRYSGANEALLRANALFTEAIRSGSSEPWEDGDTGRPGQRDMPLQRRSPA